MRKPFFKKSHACWYVHHQGRMVRLGPAKNAALLAWHVLKSSSAPAATSDSVASLMNSYLEWCQKNRSASTYSWYKEFLSSFASTLAVRDMKVKVRKALEQLEAVGAVQNSTITKGDRSQWQVAFERGCSLPHIQQSATLPQNMILRSSMAC